MDVTAGIEVGVDVGMGCGSWVDVDGGGWAEVGCGTGIVWADVSGGVGLWVGEVCGPCAGGFGIGEGWLGSLGWPVVLGGTGCK